MTPSERAARRRVFEETLAKTCATYAPDEEVLLDALVPNAAGVPVVVARYRVCRDGSFQCFEVLDDVLWPPRAE